MNKSITLIIAIVSISLLLSVNIFINPLQIADAVTFNSDIALAGANNTVFAMEAMSQFVAISTVASQQFNTMSYLRSDINAGSGGVRTIQIEPYVGGCNAVDNPCGPNSSGLALFDPINEADEPFWIGSAQGLWCGLTDCFTWWVSANSTYPHQLQRYTIPNKLGTFSLTGYMNVSSATFITIRPAIAGIDTATGGIGGITVFTVRRDATNTYLYFTGGTSLMGDVGTPHTIQAGNVNVQSMFACHPLTHDGCSVSQIAYMGVNIGTIRILNTGTHAQICQNAIGGFSNSGVIAYDEISQGYIIARDSDVFRMNQACATGTSLINADIQNYIRSLIVNEDEDVFFIYHASTATNPILTQYNRTGVNALVDFDATIGSSISGWTSGNPAPYQSMALDKNTQALIMTGDTSTARILYLNNFQSGSQGTDEVCIDTNGDGIANVCYQDTNGDGVPDSSPLELIGASQPITSVGFNLLCQIKVSENFCDNPDIMTNGVGYLYWFILWLIVGSLAFLVFGEHDRKKLVGDMNIMVIIITMVATGFIAFAWEWIDLTLPIVTIIAICGFGAKQVVAFVEGKRSGGD